MSVTVSNKLLSEEVSSATAGICFSTPVTKNFRILCPGNTISDICLSKHVTIYNGVGTIFLATIYRTVLEREGDFPRKKGVCEDRTDLQETALRNCLEINPVKAAKLTT
jgi:hypothetical protein